MIVKIQCTIRCDGEYGSCAATAETFVVPGYTYNDWGRMPPMLDDEGIEAPEGWSRSGRFPGDYGLFCPLHAK